MASAVEIIGVETLRGGLVTLQPLAEVIFGKGLRRSGWFARKLSREGVVPELCAVARQGDELIGYALLGCLSSRPDFARGAGLGVLEHMRRQGYGRALVEHVSQRAQAHGYDTELLADPRLLDWYRVLGFSPVRDELCLCAPGLGSGPRLAELALANTAIGASCAWSWAPEIWARTPASQRLVVACAGTRLWLTREGRAWLVMRAEAQRGAAIPAALTLLRRHIPAATPLLLYPIAGDSKLATQLAATGFETIQSSCVVRRPTRLVQAKSR